MKNKKINLSIWLLSISMAFNSCQKIIEPKDLPEQEPRLVMNCIVYRDSVISLNLSSSKSILSGKDYKFIDNAVCELYENGVYIGQLLNYKNGNYQSSVYPKINREYTIKASASGYEAVEGSTVLPDSVELISSERYDLINSNYRSFSTGSFGSLSISGNTKCLVRIKNNQNSKNYFSVQPVILLYDSSGNFIQEADYPFISNNNIDENSGEYSGGNTIEVSEVNLVNGSEIHLDLDISFYGEYSAIKYAEVYLVISTISEDLYKYRTTLRNQTYSGISLFAEPVLVFNNIKHGMGIMGSMNSNIYFLYQATISKN